MSLQPTSSDSSERLVIARTKFLTHVLDILDRREPGLVPTLASFEPLGLDDLVLGAVEGLVGSANGAVADFHGCANFLRRSGVTHKVRNEIETGAGDRERRTTSGNAVFGDETRALFGDELNETFEIELGAGTRHKRLCAGGVLGSEVGSIQDGLTVLVLLLLQPLDVGFECLECATHLLLRHVRHLEDFTETAVLLVLAAGYENAAGDNSVLRLALEQLLIVCHSEQHLGCVLCSLADVLRVAERGDLTKGGLERLVALVVVALVVGTRQLAHLQTTITETDLGLQLRTAQQRVGGVTDTRWVVVALVVVGERTPLGACIDAALREDATAGAADGVSGAELFDEIWGHFAAVGAHQRNIQVFRPGFLLDRLALFLIDLARREHATIRRERHVADHVLII
jgi:hypothetical protein